MDRIENGMRQKVRLQRDTKVFRFIMAHGEGKFSKLILTFLYCFKFYEINICHSVVQMHVSYKKFYR